MFDHYFFSYGSEAAEIDIKINDGAWQNVLRYQYQDASGKVIVLLDQYTNPQASYLQVRWNYKNAYDAFYWAIDNVYLLQEGIREGDINKDGAIDISDVVLCLRIAIGLDISINGQIYQYPYTSEIIEVSDIENDGFVSIIDVVMVLRLSLNVT